MTLSEENIGRHCFGG